MTTGYLVDTSVWSRFNKPAVSATVIPLGERGLLATCAPVEMEMLYTARNGGERDRIKDWLGAFDWRTTNDDCWQRAIEVQCEMIARGNHRALSMPDLLIAATAERHRLTILHYDGDYDMIAAVTGQPTDWVVPAGTAD